MTARSRRTTALLALSLPVVFAAGLFAGGVPVDLADIVSALCGKADSTVGFIVVETRVPALLTAMLGSAALAVAGLLMQTCFNNPLAGPSIMGISTGAGLGVAVVLLALGGLLGFWGRMALVAGAFIGAGAVLAVLLFFSGFVRSADVLLIIGILVGYLSSSAISLLNFFATDSSVHSYVMWGMGTFATVGLDGLPLFASLVLLFTLATAPFCKSLNAMLLGDRYAESAGVAMKRTRSAVLAIAGALTAVVTAWCGPIGFLGLVVPHVARLMCGTANHRVLLPATALAGGLLGMICQIASVAPSLATGAILPVNAITPIIGVPIIIYVLLNRRKLVYFS